MHGTHRSCAVGMMLHYRSLIKLKRQVGIELLLPALRGESNALSYVVKMVEKQTGEEWFTTMLSHKDDESRRSIIQGYSFKELYDIDHAFRSFNRINDKDAFLGLHKVLNVLLMIHDVEDKQSRVIGGRAR